MNTANPGLGASAPRRRLGLAALALPLAFAGCHYMDPTTRPGMWKPDRAVQENLAAQVANPADLVRGQGSTGTPAVLATAPVAVLNAGKLPELPTGVAASAGTAAGGSSSAGGGPASGGTSGGSGVVN
ncbi:MAG: hypothetical protein ACP5NI_10795 [Acetobacteraceae bacterium]